MDIWIALNYQQTGIKQNAKYLEQLFNIKIILIPTW